MGEKETVGKRQGPSDEGPSSKEDVFDRPTSLEHDQLLDPVAFLESLDASSAPTTGKRGKAHKSRHKWGKKDRKNRDSDPYGCHTDPTDLSTKSQQSGVNVSGGKRGARQG